MTNWIVTLVNTVEPFDMREAIIESVETISEAFGEAEKQFPTYYPRSCRFHSTGRCEQIGMMAAGA